MDTYNITSGELLYRICGLDKANLLPGEQQGASRLQQFLDMKAKDDFGALKLVRAELDALHQATSSHLGIRIPQRIQNAKQALLSDAALEKERVSHHLKSLQQRFDSVAMQSVLQYVAVVKQDMANAKKQLEQERRQKEALKKQAKVCRDFLMFCTHAQTESSGRIDITCLPHDSAQFTRCVKAVHENLGESFGKLSHKIRPSPDDTRVLNVFKVKNAHLSQRLQEAASKNPGRTKGLFCCIPAEHIFSFSIHGSAIQTLPGGDNIPLDTKANRIFGNSWVFANNTPLLPLSPELQQAYSISGTAAKLARRKGAGPVIRFSRQSSISTVMMCSEEQREYGMFLSLCRVLITKQKTVAGHITDSDIHAALGDGSDAVFSSLTEEYVLLRPAQVLPEFLIHVFFRNVDRADRLRRRKDETNDDYDSYGDEDEEGKSPLESDSALSLLIPPAGDLETNDGAAMTLLRNEYFHNKEATQSSRGHAHLRQQCNFDPQEAVRLKQNALMRIESAIEEFRSQKIDLLRSSCDRLKGLVP